MIKSDKKKNEEFLSKNEDKEPETHLKEETVIRVTRVSKVTSRGRSFVLVLW